MQGPAPIPDPVAILERAPPPEFSLPAVGILSAFEQTQFPPDTPENDLYQIALFMWEGEWYSATVFPRQYLPQFEKGLRAIGLALRRGTLYAGGAILDVNEFLGPGMQVPADGQYVYCGAPSTRACDCN